MEYIDIHLSHVAQFVWFGFLGHLDIALVEVTAILPDGSLVPSTSIGNNKTWLDQADNIILEVNSGMNAALQGMHDIYYGTRLPPHRKPIPILASGDRIGETNFRCDPDEGDRRGRDQCPRPQHHLLRARRRHRRRSPAIFSNFSATRSAAAGCRPQLLPIQSGVGNVANAVMAGLEDGPFDGADRLHRGAAGRHART